jgi:hypothetical protein
MGCQSNTSVEEHIEPRCVCTSQPNKASVCSRVEQLVALLLPLQPLHALLVHLLRHLLIPLLLLLRRTLLLECRYASLRNTRTWSAMPPPSHLPLRFTYLALGFLLILQFFLLCLHNLLRCPEFCALLVRCETRAWPEGGARGVPLLAWNCKYRSARNRDCWNCAQGVVPFFLMPRGLSGAFAPASNVVDMTDIEYGTACCCCKLQIQAPKAAA